MTEEHGAHIKDAHHRHGHSHGESFHEHEHAPLPCDGEGHEHHHHPDGSCCCHNHDVEYHGMPLVMKLRLAASAALFAVCTVLPVGDAAEAVLMILAAVIAGYDIVIAAVRGLFSREVFNEYFLMSVAAIASCLIGEFEECAAVMVMYRVGEACQSYAISQSRRKMSYYTGFYGHEKMDDGKQRFITGFSRIYTPIVLAGAALTALLLPILGNGISLSDSVNRALNFLVLACPCAIVISIPMAYFAGIGAASRQGIFFHDSHVVDSLARERSGEVFVEKKLSGGNCLVYGDTAGGSAAVISAGSMAKPLNAWKIARKTRTIAFENIWFVIIIKLAVLVLSLLGKAPLWFAVFADSGVTIIAVLNSLRAFAAK